PVDPPVATLTLEAAGDETDASLPSLLRMDIELADALERLRFEYPEVGVVVMTGATERAFRTGITGVPPGTPPDVAAAVQMYRDEVRAAIEDASADSGLAWIAALNGPASGAGYELAAGNGG